MGPEPTILAVYAAGIYEHREAESPSHLLVGGVLEAGGRLLSPGHPPEAPDHEARGASRKVAPTEPGLVPSWSAGYAPRSSLFEQTGDESVPSAFARNWPMSSSRNCLIRIVRVGNGTQPIYLPSHRTSSGLPPPRDPQRHLLFRRERLFGALASSPLSAVAYRLDGPPRREVAGQEPPGATALQCVEHTTEDVARKVNSGTPPLVSGRQVHLDVSELRVGKVFTGWSVSHRLRRSTFIRRSLEEVIKEDRPKLSERFITDSSPCVQMAELWPSSVGRALGRWS